MNDISNGKMEPLAPKKEKPATSNFKNKQDALKNKMFSVSNQAKVLALVELLSLCFTW